MGSFEPATRLLRRTAERPGFARDGRSAIVKTCCDFAAHPVLFCRHAFRKFTALAQPAGDGAGPRARARRAPAGRGSAASL
jgi:hypothetical protein